MKGINNKTGTSNAKGKHWNAKSRIAMSKYRQRLPDKDIRSILKSELPVKELSDKYKVSQRVIYRIKEGKAIYVQRILASDNNIIACNFETYMDIMKFKACKPNELPF